MTWNKLTSTACPLKLNGNMPAELVQLPNFILAMTSQKLEIMLGIVETLIVRLILLGRRNLIIGAFMICMGMFGNGFRTSGTINTTKLLLLMVVLGEMKITSPMLSGAVAGTTTLMAVGQRLATRASLVIVPTT